MTDRKLMLIDGNSLLYRAFYALPLLHNREGIYTNGVYGFLTMFNRAVAEIEPSHIMVAFDKDKKTFRNDIYQDYKGNRPPAPDELVGQFQLIRELLTALNVDYIEMQGYEADDIIGTLSRMSEEAGDETVIVTGDGDALQLVSDKTRVYMTRKGISDVIIYDPEQVHDKWEVGPEKMVELKGLMGDSSDNIPGVPGVGPKTAVKLIKEFGSLEGVYENLDKVKGKKLLEKLEANREQAFMSRELGTINRDIGIESELDKFQVKEASTQELKEFYRRVEFNNFLAALKEKDGAVPRQQAEKVDEDLIIHELINEEDIRRFSSSIDGAEGIAIYVEADYHHPMWANISKIHFEYKQEFYSLSLEDKRQSKLKCLKALLEDQAIDKYLHDSKFAKVLFLKYGINMQGIKGDTLLFSYVLDPVFQADELADTLIHYLNLELDEKNPVRLLSQLRRLYDFMAGDATDDLKKLLEETELPAAEILAEMEFCGVKVDKKKLAEISEELDTRIHKDAARIYELAGSEFNINSPKQLGKVLFEDLELPAAKKTKTGYSTGQEVLEGLYDKHEIIPYIMEYRQLTKLKSTYVDALQELIHPATKRVHTIFKQAQTATGRLSSVEPNLQNIPVKMEEGRRIRKAFVSQGPGWLILSADYSQIDLRALAHISGDETLIETFRQGIDIHTRTAAEIFDVSLERVDSDLRRRAKAVNFGIIYGISPFGLARDTGVSRKEAEKYINEYLNSYPGVRKYMDDIVEFGKTNGYVETVLKRRRYLPDLRSKNKMVQSFARRMALNTPIQGTSADIIKIAMIKVARELKERKLQSRLLLQVHDELLLEVKKDELEEVAALVKNCMESAYDLKVPLLSSLQLGSNWYDLQNWEY